MSASSEISGRCPAAWIGGGSACIPDPWTVKHRGFLHAMVHDPTTVATGKPEARWAISSRRTRSDGTPNRARTAAHASTLARLQIVTCGQALPLGSASGLWLGTVNSPEKQNARRFRRALQHTKKPLISVGALVSGEKTASWKTQRSDTGQVAICVFLSRIASLF